MGDSSPFPSPGTILKSAALIGIGAGVATGVAVVSHKYDNGITKKLRAWSLIKTVESTVTIDTGTDAEISVVEVRAEGTLTDIIVDERPSCTQTKAHCSATKMTARCLEDTTTQTIGAEPKTAPIWDPNCQWQGQMPPKMQPAYACPPCAPAAIDSSLIWGNCTRPVGYQYQPQSVLMQCCDSENIVNRPPVLTQCQPGFAKVPQCPSGDAAANQNLAQMMFDAGKHYFSNNSQITGMTSFKDVLSVCDYPQTFYKEIRHCFKAQGASHLAKVFEEDAEVQAILAARADPEESEGVTDTEHGTSSVTPTTYEREEFKKGRRKKSCQRKMPTSEKINTEAYSGSSKEELDGYRADQRTSEEEDQISQRCLSRKDERRGPSPNQISQKVIPQSQTTCAYSKKSLEQILRQFQEHETEELKPIHTEERLRKQSDNYQLGAFGSVQELDQHDNNQQKPSKSVRHSLDVKSIKQSQAEWVKKESEKFFEALSRGISQFENYKTANSSIQQLIDHAVAERLQSKTEPYYDTLTRGISQFENYQTANPSIQQLIDHATTEQSYSGMAQTKDKPTYVSSVQGKSPIENYQTASPSERLPAGLIEGMTYNYFDKLAQGIGQFENDETENPPVQQFSDNKPVEPKSKATLDQLKSGKEKRTQCVKQFNDMLTEKIKAAHMTSISPSDQVQTSQAQYRKLYQQLVNQPEELAKQNCQPNEMKVHQDKISMGILNQHGQPKISSAPHTGVISTGSPTYNQLKQLQTQGQIQTHQFEKAAQPAMRTEQQAAYAQGAMVNSNNFQTQDQARQGLNQMFTGYPINQINTSELQHLMHPQLVNCNEIAQSLPEGFDNKHVTDRSGRAQWYYGYPMQFESIGEQGAHHLQGTHPGQHQISQYTSVSNSQASPIYTAPFQQIAPMVNQFSEHSTDHIVCGGEMPHIINAATEPYKQACANQQHTSAYQNENAHWPQTLATHSINPANRPTEALVNQQVASPPLYNNYWSNYHPAQPGAQSTYQAYPQVLSTLAQGESFCPNNVISQVPNQYAAGTALQASMNPNTQQCTQSPPPNVNSTNQQYTQSPYCVAYHSNGDTASTLNQMTLQRQHNPANIYNSPAENLKAQNNYNISGVPNMHMYSQVHQPPLEQRGAFEYLPMRFQADGGMNQYQVAHSMCPKPQMQQDFSAGQVPAHYGQGQRYVETNQMRQYYQERSPKGMPQTPIITSANPYCKIEYNMENVIGSSRAANQTISIDPRPENQLCTPIKHSQSEVEPRTGNSMFPTNTPSSNKVSCFSQLYQPRSEMELPHGGKGSEIVLFPPATCPAAQTLGTNLEVNSSIANKQTPGMTSGTIDVSSFSAAKTTKASPLQMPSSHQKGNTATLNGKTNRMNSKKQTSALVAKKRNASPTLMKPNAPTASKNAPTKSTNAPTGSTNAPTSLNAEISPMKSIKQATSNSHVVKDENASRVSKDIKQNKVTGNAILTSQAASTGDKSPRAQSPQTNDIEESQEVTLTSEGTLVMQSPPIESETDVNSIEDEIEAFSSATQFVKPDQVPSSPPKRQEKIPATSLDSSTRSAAKAERSPSSLSKTQEETPTSLDSSTRSQFKEISNEEQSQREEAVTSASPDQLEAENSVRTESPVSDQDADGYISAISEADD